ncbi:MAG: tol-pal system protein YbgF [Nitrospirae bacterium]|nr:tol-pal system protein YbgF [Nitrospirota bacterium]
MTTKPFLAITSFLLLLAACVPQAEIVKISTDMSEQREDTRATKDQVMYLQKRLDILDANVKGTVDMQKALADYGAKSDQLSTDIQILQGKLEENNFRIAEVAQKLDDKSVKIAELNVRIEELEAKVRLSNAGTPMAATVQSGTASDSHKKSTLKTIEPSEAYRQAKNDFDKGNYDLALAGFQNYIVQFSDTSLAAGAQYWIGECYASKKDFTRAIEAFGLVITSYPRSEKVPGAKLKIGLSYLNAKNTEKAREYLNKVIKEHHGTAEADIATDRLSKIGQ